MIFSIVRKLLQHFGISYLASFLGFLVILMTARILGAEQFAWVAAGIAAGSFAIPLTSLGSDLTFVRDAIAAPNIAAVEEMVLTNLNTRVTMLLIVSSVLSAGSLLYTGSLINGIGAATVAIWTALQGLNPSAWFDYLKKTHTQNVVVLVERACSALMICLFWFVSQTYHVAAFLGAALLFTRLISIATQIGIWWKLFGGKRFQFRLLLPQQKHGNTFQVTFAQSANGIMTYGNQLLLRGNKIDLAAYGLTFQIMGLIFIFQGQAQRLLSRQMVEACQFPPKIFPSMLRGIFIIAGGSAILAITATLLIEFLPVLLADQKYEAMSKYSPLFSIWVIIAGAGISVAQHLVTLHQDGFYLITAVGGGAIAMCLGFVFIPEYGGAAAITILLTTHFSIITLNFIRLLIIIRRKVVRSYP